MGVQAPGDDKWAKSRHWHTSMANENMSTGVHVGDDGRLDIQFHGPKRNLGSLIQYMKHSNLPDDESAEQVVGSRGDVQPFIGIGKELQKYGHRVRLATHQAFKDFVEDHGLEFFNIGGDPAQLMAFMVENPGLMPGMKAIRHGEIGRRRQEMCTIIEGCWRSCYEPSNVGMSDQAQSHDKDGRPFVADALIANPPSFAHLSCAETLGIPLNMMFTMPWSATQAFPHPLAKVGHHNTKPSIANFTSYAVVEMMIWEGLGGIINHFRQGSLGLDPLDAIRAPGIAHKLRIPYTYLWSPSLLPKPKDWSKNIDVDGFVFLSKPADYQPPAELVAFLENGPAPIYVGFGSIVVDDPSALTELIFTALRQSGQRAVVNKGWGNIGASEVDIPDTVYMIGSCPHDWLFQHISCVVHHGGAGTTAAGLLLGRPTVIIPFFGDQPFWGSIVERAGAGPAPIPYHKLTAEKLATAIKAAGSPDVQFKAKEIGDRMKLEHGAQDAARSFHKHIDFHKLTCAILPHRPAVWWVQHRDLRLSALAAAVLIADGLLSLDDIVLYRSVEYTSNYDPRGPLAAGGEILYEVLSDFISGVVDVPAGLAKALEPHRHHEDQESTRMDDAHQSINRNEGNSSVYHGASSQEHRQRSMQDPSDIAPEDRVLSSLSLASDSSRPEGPTCDHPDQEDGTTSGYHQRKLIDLERLMARRRAQTFGARTRKRSIVHGTARGTKQLLDWVIMIPTDITLSLSKGFHNFPKIYHDTTIKETPNVMGVRSGCKAAGTEFANGFYQGITGMFTHPVQGLRHSGPCGMLKGVGKGVGGIAVKPVAGLWGLLGYPLDGIHKRIRASLARDKLKGVIVARLTQGMEERLEASLEEKKHVIQRWNELCGSSQQA